MQLTHGNFGLIYVKFFSTKMYRFCLGVELLLCRFVFMCVHLSVRYVTVLSAHTKQPLSKLVFIVLHYSVTKTLDSNTRKRRFANMTSYVLTCCKEGGFMYPLSRPNVKQTWHFVLWHRKNIKKVCFRCTGI